MRKILNLFDLIKTETDSQWASTQLHGVPGVPTYNGKPVVLAENVLDALRNYVNSLTLSFTFDHAVGFFE